MSTIWTPEQTHQKVTKLAKAAKFQDEIENKWHMNKQMYHYILNPVHDGWTRGFFSFMLAELAYERGSAMQFYREIKAKFPDTTIEELKCYFAWIIERSENESKRQESACPGKGTHSSTG